MTQSKCLGTSCMPLFVVLFTQMMLRWQKLDYSRRPVGHCLYWSAAGAAAVTTIYPWHLICGNAFNHAFIIVLISTALNGVSVRDNWDGSEGWLVSVRDDISQCEGWLRWVSGMSRVSVRDDSSESKEWLGWVWGMSGVSVRDDWGECEGWLGWVWGMSGVSVRDDSGEIGRCEWRERVCTTVM